MTDAQAEENSDSLSGLESRSSIALVSSAPLDTHSTARQEWYGFPVICPPEAGASGVKVVEVVRPNAGLLRSPGML
eukprot:scaffold135417_cov25-Prasinocladus_malaysianus.AAC.3